MRGALAIALLALIAGEARSEQPERHRFRVSFGVGGSHYADEVRSDAANTLNLLNSAGETINVVLDPRDDAAISGNLGIQAGALISASFQYRISPRLALEASIAGEASDVGEIEVQGRLAFPNRDFFRFIRVPAGELRRVPIQLSALYVFRPGRAFRPYLGGGVGYTLYEFDPGPELDAFSLAMDRSLGIPRDLASLEFPRFPPSDDTLALMTGAVVDVADSFDSHVVAGADFALGRRWSFFVELRYTASNREMTITFNGSESLGVSVPQATVPEGSPVAEGFYGPYWLYQGGLMDLNRDGTLDPGYYYATGGSLDLDTASGRIGARISF